MPKDVGYYAVKPKNRSFMDKSFKEVAKKSSKPAPKGQKSPKK